VAQGSLGLKGFIVSQRANRYSNFGSAENIKTKKTACRYARHWAWYTNDPKRGDFYKEQIRILREKFNITDYNLQEQYYERNRF
jgi:hypothetical protein